MKDRESRVIQADVAMHKGRGEEEVVEQAVDNIRRLGHKKLIIKTDYEPALISLRDEVIKKLEDVQIIPEAPPQEESQSSGCMDNTVKLLKGELIVHRLALESKIQGTVPTHHAIMTWLVSLAAECITK